MLASLLFPYDEDAPKLIDGWLAELEREDMVRRYVHSGDTYLEIRNWLKHQKIDKPSVSKLPSFDESSRLLAESSRTFVGGSGSGTGTKDQGREGIASTDACAEPELSLRSAPAPENGTPMHPTLFPAIGAAEPVQIAASKAAEYRETFAGIDVDAELAKAAQWLRDNPSRRKTAKGLPRYLFAWLERAQNRGAGTSPAQGQAKPQLSAYAPRPSLGALQIELAKVREEIADILHPGGCAGTVEPTGDKRTRYDALVERRKRIQSQIEGLT